MNAIGLVTAVAFIVGASMAGDQQTFFIYPDRQLRQAPADEATIPLCAPEDTTQIVAYAGAVWGEYDLSEREDCLAWCVASSAQLDSFLTSHNYRRMSSQDAP